MAVVMSDPTGTMKPMKSAAEYAVLAEMHATNASNTAHAKSSEVFAQAGVTYALLALAASLQPAEPEVTVSKWCGNQRDHGPHPWVRQSDPADYRCAGTTGAPNDCIHPRLDVLGWCPDCRRHV